MVRLYPTFSVITDIPCSAAKCQEETHAVQQTKALFDHVGGAGEQGRRLLCGLHPERLRDRGELVADLLDAGGEFGRATDIDDLTSHR